MLLFFLSLKPFDNSLLPATGPYIDAGEIRRQTLPVDHRIHQMIFIKGGRSGKQELRADHTAVNLPGEIKAAVSEQASLYQYVLCSFYAGYFFRIVIILVGENDPAYFALILDIYRSAATGTFRTQGAYHRRIGEPAC